MQMELKKVPTDQVIIDTVALRHPNKESKEWADMVQSVATKGILQPLLGRMVGDRVVVIDGGHRFEAAKDAGLPTVPVNIASPPDDITTDEQLKVWIMQLQISCNVHKFQTKPGEYAKQVLACVMHDRTKPLSFWAETFNKSETWLRDRLKIAKMHPDALELADTGAITPSNLIFLAKLPEEEQPDWFDKAQTDDYQTFVSAVSARVSEISREKRGLKKAQEWQPSSRVRGKTDLINIFTATYEALKDIPQEDRDNADKASVPYNVGYFDGIRYALSLDDEAVEEQRAKHQAAIQEKEMKKLQKAEQQQAASPGSLLGKLIPKDKQEPVITADSLV